jgi:glutathione S-transferase
MSLKPIKLYGGGKTPSPMKVAIVLEELGFAYEATGPLEWKEEPYISVNSNGRTPSIEDTNTGVTMFEVFIVLFILLFDS